jgi:hypothetical protein
MSESWEDVINQVIIPGDPAAINNAAAAWTQLFRGIRDVRQGIDHGLIQLEEWKGAAGEAYRTSIGKLAKDLESLDVENNRIDQVLGDASTNLASSMKAIPLPVEMLHVIEQKRADFANSTPNWPLPHNEILEWFIANFDPSWMKYFGLGSFLLEPVAKWLRDWIDPNAQHARDIYGKLDNHYATVVANMPDGKGHSEFGGTTQTALNPQVPGPHTTAGGGAGFGGGGKLPGSGSFDPGAGYTPGGYDPATGAGSYDPSAGQYGYNPDDFSGSGLAGVGGGGFTGVGGLGAGGLTGVGPGGGAGGLGMGGLSPTGLVGMKGIGTPTSPYGPGGVPMMGGMPAGGARGAGGSRRPGLVGGGGGPGGRGNDDGRGTWLQEDDDVWGTDSGAAPPLLT